MPAPQNWVIENSRRAPPILGADPRDRNLPAGMTSNAHGVSREVQANELMSTHADELSRGNNRLIQNARARGVRSGAARGGINSNLAAASGEDSALAQVGEMAAQQAGAYGTAAGQNLSSLSSQRIAGEGNQASLGVASIGANASMYNSDQNLLSQREGRLQDRDLTLSGRDFTRSEREGDQSWRSGESERSFNRESDYTTRRDETQHGYQRELEQDRYGYGQREADEQATRESDQYLFRQLIDNPEEFDPEVLQGLQAFFASFRPRRGPK